MNIQRISLIEEYRKRVVSANKEQTKKELFKDLLHRLYPGDEAIGKILDAFSMGAEKTIFNIPRKDKVHRGSADTLYNKIIIEFENDLRSSLTHAREQLSGYLLGSFNSGEGYHFTLIASDFIAWKVFSPDVSCIDRLDTLKEDELILNEIPTASFTLTEQNAEDFYYWIDRFLFREEKQHASLQRVEESFGYHSATFIECYRQLAAVFQEVQKYGEVQVSYEQWLKFLSIAYGSYEDKGNDFIIHTYLSVFAKMLAYSVLSADDFIEERELKAILDGSVFQKFNIANFSDNDFFHWVGSERNFRELKKVFRMLAQEIATFDFSSVDEDILKGVYQELIDLDTRHALGEYYTPDWLCTRITMEFDFKPGQKILDPACGSGSFLRAAIHRMKELNPEITAEELNQAVYGIDIHPLSVQIAKTTVLLALGKGIINAKRPVQLNVIQANTLLAPEGVQNLFGGEFSIAIDKHKYALNTQIFEDVLLFDTALQVCDDLAETTIRQKVETIQVFETILRKQYKNGGLSQQVIESFYKLYLGFKLVRENNRDSIWKFIVQNLYKPYFFAGKFDYIIGNPPWFTFSSVRNEEYQNTLNAIAENYSVKPERKANFPHLEIAAIFLAYCSSYFLKENGQIAFVLPRSFFSADHHENTRAGKSQGFRLTHIWDFDKVKPLFRIPCCVLFADKSNGKNQVSSEGIEGITFSGNIPSHNCNYSAASNVLAEQNVSWFYIKQGKSTAFSTSDRRQIKSVNPYKQLFKQGATIVPRPFYFVELDQQIPPDWRDRIVNLKTSAEIEADGKKPWKGIELNGKMESLFLFRTALSKSILPFALHKPALVTLPVTLTDSEENGNRIAIHSADELLQLGYMNASRWFKKAENIWNILRTAKNKKISFEDYLNWQNKLTNQKLDSPFLVLYNSSAKDANAVMVRRKDFDLPFIVESKAYWFATDSIYEAFYLSAVLNSSLVNQSMKAFQTRGLFGPRDVHKKILDIVFPRYNEKKSRHFKLAQLGTECHELARQFLLENPPEQNLSAYHLGRIRLEIKKHLDGNLIQIDRFVKEII